jgi:hypothetical protein
LIGQTLAHFRITAKLGEGGGGVARFDTEASIRRALHRFRATSYVPYDVARNGERFLMMQLAHGDPDPREIDLVLGWFQELRGLMPTS